MRPHGDKFLAILGAELDDLVRDLKDAESLYAARYTSGEVSGYVLRENTAVLEQEIAGVMSVRSALRERSLPDQDAAQPICVWFEALCREVLERNGHPVGILGFLTRRCAKVARYIYEE